MGRHSSTDAPVRWTGALSRFSRRDAAWAAALAVSVALGFGGVAVAAAAGDQVVCPPGVSLEVRPDGTWRCLPTVDPSPSGSPSTSPTASPTVAPTPTSSPTPTSTPPPPPGFPTASTAGVPTGWTPSAIRTSWTINAPGVYTDIRVTGTITVKAQGVTLRRVEVVGGIIDNEDAGRCYNGLVLEDVTVRQGSTYTNAGADGVIGPGGYTARRVSIVDRVEGFRVGGVSAAGCGPVVIEDSFARITPPRPCGDWHGDGVQAYDGGALTIRRSTIEFVESGGCNGTAPFYYVTKGGAGPVVVDQLLVSGGGFPFRLGVPATVRGVRVADGTWGYGPVDVACSKVSVWEDVQVSDPAGVALRPIRCTGTGT